MPNRDAKAPFSHQGAGSAKEEWRDGADPLGGVRNSPSAAVAGGWRKDSKSRRRDRSRNPRREWTTSGESLAGSARSKSHGKSEIFARVVCTGVADMELADDAVQFLGMGKDRKEFMVHLCMPQGPGRCEETGAALHIGKWSVVPGEADRGVGGASVERREMTETGQGPEIAEAGPALFGPIDSEGRGAQVATLAGELGLDPRDRWK